METLHDSRVFSAADESPSVALGNFDGVHLGHQAIIRAAMDDAAERSVPSLVYTFEPHPGAVVGRGEPPRLTTPDEKAACIETLGPDYLLVEAFTKHFASQSAEDFVEHVLVGRLGAGAVFVGEDFGFGRGRAGNVETLRSLGETLGFTVTAVGAVLVDGERVSSSVIRRLVGAGEVGEAARRLTRPYAVGGTVVHGHDRGKSLGVHTANLAPEKYLLPSRGVYACRVVLADGRKLPAVTNVGVKPTFGGEELTVEAHVLDFDGDLYDQRISVEFIERLRNERRFDTPEDLVKQIHRDIERTREVLSAASP